MNAGAELSMQPLICSTRLRLCPMRHEDFPALLALWAEPEVGQYLGQGEVLTRAQWARLLADYAQMAPEGLGLWRVYRAADGAALGCVTLKRGPRPDSVEPAAMLHPRWRGQGYAEEALGALLAHAAEALGAQGFVAHCCVPDQAGDRLLRRLGFVGCYEGDAGRFRVRQYRPGVRRGDSGLVTRLFR
jgi:RimJ/RimL family protein N-acetyltransferase